MRTPTTPPVIVNERVATPLGTSGSLHLRQYLDGPTLESKCANCGRVIYLDDEDDWRHRVNDWMLCERVPA